MKSFIFILITVMISTILSQDMFFVLCEGNFMAGNSSLWSSQDDSELIEYVGNPIGDTGQSLKYYHNNIYVVLNGSSRVDKYIINENNELVPDASISTNFSGPREIEFYGNTAYVTEWYSNSIMKLDLASFDQVESIPLQGMPEDLIVHGEMLYVSMIMNPDWSASDKIVAIDLVTDELVEEYTVGYGPGQMAIIGNKLYISGTYYDENYVNTYTVTSRINLEDGSVFINEYGPEDLFGNDLTVINGEIYRTYNGGVVQLDEQLNPILESQMGNYENVYSMDSYGGRIFLGISDFIAPDQVIILNPDGSESSNYTVGAIPGSFTFISNTDCLNTGDLSGDNSLDILDIVMMIGIIISGENQSEIIVCVCDSNNDGVVDVNDIVYWMNIILFNP